MGAPRPSWSPPRWRILPRQDEMGPQPPHDLVGTVGRQSEPAVLGGQPHDGVAIREEQAIEAQAHVPEAPEATEDALGAEDRHPDDRTGFAIDAADAPIG